MIFYVHVCTCTICLIGTHRGQKKQSDPLKLELVFNHHVGSGDQNQVPEGQPVFLATGPFPGLDL